MCSTDIYPKNPIDYDGPRVTNTETFIRKAKWVHGNKYDYTDTTYSQSHTKCKIFCPSHNGYFKISPTNHTSGKGCNVCTNKVPISSDVFIERANKIHHNFYDYSSVQYRGSQEYVTIICPLHGEFSQTPSQHMNGRKCRDCARSLNSEKQRFTLSDFEKKAREIHGDRYGYISYNTYLTNATILCNIHGEFSQSPSNHIQGKGCPECASIRRTSYSTLSESISNEDGIFYHIKFIREDDTSFEKIGVTSRSIKERFSALRPTGLQMEVISETIGTYEECVYLERAILKNNEDERFKVHDLRGTVVGGWTECFPSGVLIL